MGELGDYLKSLRGDKSLREVSKACGISHTYLDSLEKGYDPRTKNPREVSFRTLRGLSNYYNIPYLLLLLQAGIINDKDISEVI